MSMGERKQKILGTIARQYSRTGEPVGSKTLSELLDLSVSPATLRNEMAALGALGYLEQLHTSGGRIPSQMGYRYYVDHLLQPKPLAPWEAERIRAKLKANAGDPERLLADAGRVLAELTDCISFFTTVADDMDCVQGIELIPAGRSKAMIVMLTTSGIIKSSVCRTQGPIDEEFKRVFYHVVNEHFVGTPVCEVSTVMIQTMAAQLGSQVFRMVPVLISLSGLCEEAAKSEIMMEGETNFFSRGELSDAAAALLGVLAKREELRDLLHGQMSRSHPGVRVIIGQENPLRELYASSMVLGQYRMEDREGGTIGVIGSTRMDYEAVIPKVAYITDYVGKLLSETSVEE